ncbi:MAG: allophanate hydrolase, partial [Moraxellaceae bacterium]|nr:allophanate hydrolase [Moraxellaceae bacterium]
MSDTHAWTIADWQAAYRSGKTPRDLLLPLLAELAPGDKAWISVVNPAALGLRLHELDMALTAAGGDVTQLPLFGVPFAVKDNIDVAGLPTTCACPEFAYTPTHNASVVSQLLAAGAVVIGKTNLDQFATGLVGTRSPYGAVPNSFNPDYISGGSSSGSATLVARGVVPFSLGTDTAGSGRVPAGFNNIVGLKPTRGWLSTAGVVPACRTLDCVSVFALTVNDAEYVAKLAGGLDERDPYSRQMAELLPLRPRKTVLGIPTAPEWFGDANAAEAFADACARWTEMGIELRPLDFTPLHETAALLYEGPWVAERYAALQSLLDTNPAAINPVVHGIIDRARDMSAVDVFTAEYRRAALAVAAQNVMQGIDALLVPTTPSIYTQAEIAAEPVQLNSRLGTWTNFVNLLDWCALALPAGFRRDGLPVGITLIGNTWQDGVLADLGRRWQAHAPWTLGASQGDMP